MKENVTGWTSAFSMFESMKRSQRAIEEHAEGWDPLPLSTSFVRDAVEELENMVRYVTPRSELGNVIQTALTMRIDKRLGECKTLYPCCVAAVGNLTRGRTLSSEHHARLFREVISAAPQTTSPQPSSLVARIMSPGRGFGAADLVGSSEGTTSTFHHHLSLLS